MFLQALLAKVAAAGWTVTLLLSDRLSPARGQEILGGFGLEIELNRNKLVSNQRHLSDVFLQA